MDLNRSFFWLTLHPLVEMWKRGGCWFLRGRHQFVANKFRWCRYRSCSKWLGYRVLDGVTIEAKAGCSFGYSGDVAIFGDYIL